MNNRVGAYVDTAGAVADQKHSRRSFAMQPDVNVLPAIYMHVNSSTLRGEIDEKDSVWNLCIRPTTRAEVNVVSAVVVAGSIKLTRIEMDLSGIPLHLENWVRSAGPQSIHILK